MQDYLPHFICTGTLCLVLLLRKRNHEFKTQYHLDIEDESDKQKMLAGELYSAVGKLLTKERDLAHHACWEYTHQFGGATDYHRTRREAILEKFLGSFPHDSPPWIEPGLIFDYGYNIHLGKRFYANFGLVILDGAKVTIGDDVMCAPNVQIYTAFHPLDPKIRNFAPAGEGLELTKPICIGNSCWIGGGAIILPGVVIGDNVTVAAGAVVAPGNKDIESGSCVVAGVPAKVIRRF